MRKLKFYSAMVLVAFFLAGCDPQSESEISDQTAQNNGSQLYASFCTTCHGSNATGGIGPAIRGASAGQISQALNSVSQMNSLQGRLTASDINAIAAFLGSLNSSNKPLTNKIQISGVVKVDTSVSGLIELKDNSGKYLRHEIHGGKFHFEHLQPEPPIMLRYSDNTGVIMYGLSQKPDNPINVSFESTKIISQFVEPGLMFDSCAAYSIACFDGPDLYKALAELAR